MAEMFCPKCGETKGEFINGFCRKCFLEDNKLVELPKSIEISHCKKCGKILVRGKWLEQSDSSLKAAVESQLKIKRLSNHAFSIDLKPLDNGKMLATVSAIGKIGKDNVNFDAETLLVLKEAVCQECNLLGANYYEAVLQIRFARKMKQEQFDSALGEIESLAEQLHKKDSLSKITSVEKLQNGFNAKIGSKHAAKRIVDYFEREYRAKAKTSFTLAGVDASGKERKRYTFLLRI